MIAFLSAIPLHAQSDPEVSSDGDRVPISQVWNSLPDFVCKERIVSSTLAKGKTKEQRVIESIFMAQRKTQTRSDGSSLLSIVESRELTTIDGKPVSQSAKLPSVPLLFDGLAVNILFISDAIKYRTGSVRDQDDRLTIRIGYTTGNLDQFLQLEFPAAVASFQIDTLSSKTLHVESRLESLRGRGIPISADFQSIRIDGRVYWLPRLVKAEAAMETNETATYVAEYTDCRKFEVTVKIRPVSAVPSP